MKLKHIGLLIFAPLLLFGCTEEVVLESNDESLISTNADSETSIDLSSYPENVANGTVSVEMYEASQRYINGVTDRLNAINAYQKRLNADGTLQVDEDFKKGYLAAIEEYEVFIKGFYLSPSTEADFEINDSFSDTLYYDELFASSCRAYVNEYLNVYKESIIKYNQSSKTSYMAFIDTLDKYELFIDSK